MAKNAAKKRREHNARQAAKLAAAARAAGVIPAAAAAPPAAPGGQLASTYADGSYGTVRDGKLVLVDRNGNVIEGATPFVNGNTRGYRTPVDALTDLPAGSYDPALLYQAQNANLGQLYNNQDFQTAWKGYDPNNPDARPGDLADAGRNVQDYWNSRGALAEALARANQDYGTGTETIGRNYRTLGNNQLQSINQSGALGGGALAQALAKRTANQGRDQGELDLSWKRYADDNARATTDLTTGFRRGYADGSVTLQRGGESNALYQAGLLGSAGAQANQSGQLVDNPNYQTHNGVVYQVTPDGQRKPVSPEERRRRQESKRRQRELARARRGFRGDRSLHPTDGWGFDPTVPPTNPYGT